MTDIAIVGLGRMGRAMAERLVGEGHAVSVWNRTGAIATDVAAASGAAVLASPREAAAFPLVVVSLADDAALRATYGGENGIVAGLGAGTVVIETSTVDPETITVLAREVAATGADLLDAPVSGSVPAVTGGTLTFMVGGDAQAAERAQPVFEALGRATFHLGDHGRGAAMKLAVNAVVHALNATVSESLVLAEAAGIDRATAYEVFASSAAGAPFLEYKRAAFAEPEATPPAFSLALVAKDLTLIQTLAARLGTPVPQAEQNLRVARAAVDEGAGERDMSWLAQRFRSSVEDPDDRA